MCPPSSMRSCPGPLDGPASNSKRTDNMYHTASGTLVERRRVLAGLAGASAGQDRGWRLKVNFAKLQREKSERGGSSAGLTFLAPCRTAPERHLRLPLRGRGHQHTGGARSNAARA